MNSSWDVDELHEGYLPDDCYHLWNILARNPQKLVRMNSIKTDLKLIKNIIPEEIKFILNAIYDIIKNSLNDSHSDSLCTIPSNEQIQIPLYTYLGMSYLKYGLAGIEVKQIKYCFHCGKEESDHENALCIINNEGGHDFETTVQDGFQVKLCKKCGSHRKIGINTPDTIMTFGVCVTTMKTPVYQTYRKLFCPIEES